MVDRILYVLFPNEADLPYIDKLDKTVKENCSAFFKTNKKCTSLVYMSYKDVIRFNTIQFYTDIKFLPNIAQQTSEFSEPISTSRYLRSFKSQGFFDTIMFLLNGNNLGIKILKNNNITKDTPCYFIEPNDYQKLISLFMKNNKEVQEWILNNIVGKIIVTASGNVINLGDGAKLVIKENYNRLY